MISTDAKYWIWLTQALGYNNKKVKGLFELYEDIGKFAQGGEREWKFCGILSGADIEKLKKTDFSVADRILESCRYYSYSVLSVSDPEYPGCLRNLYAPPAVIYISGSLPDIDNRLTIGIVGTRTASHYGIKNAFEFGYSLSKFGVCVISGGALGVDCASHRGVLSAGGTTVCVLGCGINYPYLKDNEGMRRQIAQTGAVVSEYPPDTPPNRYTFPDRNRIIAAMSDGVMIIESGEKSGSLITADIALEMGKSLFALMGNNDPRNAGSNQRIKEGTAIPVTDFMDILTEFEGLYITGSDPGMDSILLADIEAVPVKGKKPGTQEELSEKGNNKKKATGSGIGSKKTEKPKQPLAEPKEKPGAHRTDATLSDEARQLYEAITDEPVHIDTIAHKLHIPVYKALSTLTLLEMQGLIKALPGRMYRLS